MSQLSANEDLIKVELCKHGPSCKCRAQGICGFAHSLAELLPPNESRQPYPGVWSDGTDRFYGQKLHDDQVVRIHKYWKETPACDTPQWAKAVHWFYGGLALHEYAECQADFGIEQDWRSLARMRCQWRRPFRWAEGVWHRI